MWWSVVVMAGLFIVVLVVGWRLRRLQSDIGDEFEGEYCDPPLFHNGPAPH
jgi:hypothetical protein